MSWAVPRLIFAVAGFGSVVYGIGFLIGDAVANGLIATSIEYAARAV